MLDELNQAIEEYQTKWRQLIADRANKPFFQNLKPTSIGWKVADRAEYDQAYAQLHDQCDRIIETWMNGRWIAKLHLRDAKLAGDVQIIKLMQRRPGSDDTLDLDHVDFYSPPLNEVEQILQKEPDLKWTHEDNDVVQNYSWISIWFDGAEAKLKPGTILDIIITELQETNQQILK
jgi:hypothetical protein